MERRSIAIDGPAGAGKSTVAKAIAERLGMRYLDTGAMYRAVALSLLSAGIELTDEPAIAAALPGTDIVVRYDARGQRVLYNGEDVTDALRTPEISSGASLVGKLPCVREKLVKLQQAVARENDVVMDGRDITTVVLPNTPYKFYVTANASERARRRLAEMRQKGDAAATFEAVLADIEKRDLQDATRECMPLRIADDTVVVDTSEMDADAALDFILGAIDKKRREGA